MGTTKNFSFWRMVTSNVSSSMVLIIFTILALICANAPGIKEIYFSVWQNPVSLSIGGFNFLSHGGHALTLGELVNDLLMSIFFLSVGLEIKRELREGELSTPKKAMLPIVGALGGMIVPVLTFFIVCPSDPEMQRGLAIPMATDIAFSLGVLALFKTRVPIGLKIFLAALAVADDLGGIIVIALFYTSDINLMYIGFSALCVIVMIAANFFSVRSKAFYMAVGLVLWYTMLNSGIHPTISGVITAFCIPATLLKGTGYYIEHIRKRLKEFPVIEVDQQHKTIVLTKEQIHTLKSIETAADKMISPLQELENTLQFPVNYLVIPFFAFANAGIDLSVMSFSDLFSGVGLAVILGLVAGKFIGIFSFSWIAIRLKFVSLPANTTWQSFASVCVVCGIGFTVSMFIADLSFAGVGASGATLLDQAKLGVLCGSVLSAVIGCVLLNKTLPEGNTEVSGENREHL